jgi:type II secretory pathway component PulJ
VGKLQENPKGFSAIEALLILVIVAIIGGTGWYIWHSRSNTDKTLTANSSSTSNFNKKGTPSKAPTQSTGPTAD